MANYYRARFTVAHKPEGKAWQFKKIYITVHSRDTSWAKSDAELYCNDLRAILDEGWHRINGVKITPLRAYTIKKQGYWDAEPAERAAERAAERKAEAERQKRLEAAQRQAEKVAVPA
ncbi:MAG TPA: hypothetical protein VH593_06110 [Ktedonobacteraceae bacterium]